MQLQIVIPTANRPRFLSRLLRYYRDQHTPHRLLVADSSLPPAAEENQRLVEVLRPSLDVRYQRYDATTPVAQKIARALEGIETPYAALGADDDFSVTAALERAAAFLEASPDYAVAHGDAVLVTATPAPAANGGGAGVSRYAQRSVEGPTGAARLLDHLMHYSLTFYAVHRTEHLRQHWKAAAAADLDYEFVELLPSCLSVIQGKRKKLDGLYLVRQGHAAQTSVTSLVGAFEWLAAPSWGPQQTRCRQVLADALARQDGLSRAEAGDVVTQAWWAYLSQRLRQEWQERYARPRPAAVPLGRLRAAARQLPPLRRAWRAVRSRLPGGEFSVESLCRPSSRYHRDFMPIYRALMA